MPRSAASHNEPTFTLEEIEAETRISRAKLKRDARMGRLPGATKDLGGRYRAPMPAADSPYVVEWKRQPRSRARADIRATGEAGAEITLLRERIERLLEQLVEAKERFRQADAERVRLLERVLDEPSRDRNSNSG